MVLSPLQRRVCRLLSARVSQDVDVFHDDESALQSARASDRRTLESAKLTLRVLRERPSRSDLTADAALPGDSRLWAALQDVSGGAWGGAVYDVERILEVIEAGKLALAEREARRAG